MLSNWRSALVPSFAFFLGGCQVISGLSGLDADGEEVTASSGAGSLSGGVTGATSTGSGAGGEGGGGGAGSGAGGGVIDLQCNATHCPSRFVADAGVSVDYLAVSDMYIVWASQGSMSVGGEIWKASTDGGDVEVAAYAVLVRGLVTADLKAYVISDNIVDTTVLSVPLSGGKPTPVATETLGKAAALALDDVFLYWAATDAGRIRRSSLPGGSMPIDYIVDGVGTPRELAVEGPVTYWNGADNGANSIKSFELVSGAPKLANIATSTSDVFDVAYVLAKNPTSGYVYWTVNQGNMAGQVRRARADATNSPSSELVLDGLSFPTYLAADANLIYWVEREGSACPSPSTIRVRSVDPMMTGVKTLAKLSTCPSNLVSHGGYLYFGAGAAIYKVQE